MPSVLDIVLPVFGLIGLGYALARLGVLGERARDGLSDFVFFVALPALLFRTLTEAKLPSALPWAFWLAYFVAVFAVWVAGTWLTRRLFARDEREGALAGMSAGYSNTVFVGLPLVLKAYGEVALVPAALLIAVHLPVLMTVLTLQVERAVARDGGRPSLARLARSLATHPILLGLAAGGAARAVGYAPSGPVKVIVDALTATTVPTALVATGLALAGIGLTRELAPAVLLTTLKLLAHPFLVWLAVTRLVPLDPLYAGTAVLMAAAPCGITSFMLAQRYGIGVPLASTTLALSTAAAVATSTLWLIVLRAG